MSPKRPTTSTQPANKASRGAASPRADEGRLAKVLVAPIVSEKALQVGQRPNVVLFKVQRSATTPEVRAAIELMFKVEVQNPVVNIKGKSTRFGGRKHRVLKPALASTRIASEDLDAAVQSIAG